MTEKEPADNQSVGNDRDAQTETVPKEEYYELQRENERLAQQYNELADTLFEIEQYIESLAENDQLLREARNDVRSDTLESLENGELWENES